MKKLVSLLICLALSLTLMGTVLADEEPLRFTLLTTNSAGRMYDVEQMAWYQEVFKRANVDIDIEIVDASAFTDVVNTRLATNTDIPDVVRLGTSQAAYYYDAGMFMDLTEFYEKDAKYVNVMFEINPTLKSQITTVDGKMYFLPYVYTMKSNERCLMINYGYCDVLGIDPESITTIDAYYDYLCKVRDNDVNQNGDPNDEVPLFVMYKAANGIHQLGVFFDLDEVSNYMVDENGSMICTKTCDAYKEYLTWCKKLYDEGLLYNEFSSAWTDTRSALFTANQIGSTFAYISNTSGYSQLINPEWNLTEDEPIMMPHMIQSVSGKEWTYGRDSLGVLFAISSKCDKEKAEKIFQFMDYLYSDEVGMLTWYGIEGIDYEIKDGTIVFNDVYTKNADSYLVKMGYNNDMLPGYQFDYMTKESPIVREWAVKMGDYIFAPTFNFTFKTEDEQEVINNYNNDLNTYFDENMTAFITGTRDLNTWDEYVAGAKAMGLDEVLATLQQIEDR